MQQQCRRLGGSFFSQILRQGAKPSLSSKAMLPCKQDSRPLGSRMSVEKLELGLDQISNKWSTPLPGPDQLDMVPSGWVWRFYFSIAIADWGGGFQTLETWSAGEKQ